MGIQAPCVQLSGSAQLQSRAILIHSELGQSLLFPEGLPSEKLWVQIKNITGCEPDIATKHESEIRKAYNEDFSHYSGEISNSEPLRSSSAQDKQMLQTTQRIDPESYGRLSIKGIGDFDLSDNDTIELAESALKILRKKISVKKPDFFDSMFVPST